MSVCAALRENRAALGRSLQLRPRDGSRLHGGVRIRCFRFAGGLRRASKLSGKPTTATAASSWRTSRRSTIRPGRPRTSGPSIRSIPARCSPRATSRPATTSRRRTRSSSATVITRAVFELCARTERDYRAACYQGLGGDAIVDSAKHAFGVVAKTQPIWMGCARSAESIGGARQLRDRGGAGRAARPGRWRSTRARALCGFYGADRWAIGPALGLRTGAGAGLPGAAAATRVSRAAMTITLAATG